MTGITLASDLHEPPYRKPMQQQQQQQQPQHPSNNYSSILHTRCFFSKTETGNVEENETTKKQNAYEQFRKLCHRVVEKGQQVFERNASQFSKGTVRMSNATSEHFSESEIIQEHLRFLENKSLGELLIYYFMKSRHIIW